ncbi:MAG: LacI family DNA-binding transcriptional regulator, partial [Corallincola sp.]|nr:LacI family DNA-binding transcriptional regulator [Corallincola sp.]
MTITIKDVAKAAGVAVSTVSKVMSDSPTISRETKERVRQLMTELGYHPNRAARALAQGSALSIGVLMRLERD